MTRKEQQKFVRDLSRSLTDFTISAIRTGEIPREWDGHELRAYMAELFNRAADVSVIRTASRNQRARDYRNALATKNL